MFDGFKRLWGKKPEEQAPVEESDTTKQLRTGLIQRQRRAETLIREVRRVEQVLRDQR